MTTLLDVDESLLDATVMDRGGYPYLIHPLMDGVPRVEPALLQEFAAWAQAQPAIQQANVLLAPEAMGIPLAVAVSLATNKPYLVIRKRQYGLDGETIAYCETGYGESCLYVNGLQPGDRAAIVDDVLSTGGTMDALLTTLEGMDVELTGVCAFIDKGEAAAKLTANHHIPIAVMRRIRVGDRVEVL